MNCMAYPPLILFSTINGKPISVNNFSFTSVFSAYHSNPGAERIFAGSK